MNDLHDASTSIIEDNRPEWLPKKFNKPEDLAKSYQELEKKIGSFVGAPDEYQIPESTKSKALAEVLSRKGKELNMSQDALNQIISEYDHTKTTKREAFKSKIESLDPEQKNMVNEVITFLKNNLGDNDSDKISKMINSVEDVMIFDKLRKLKNPLTSGEKVLTNEMAPMSPEKYLKSIDRERLYVKGDLAYRREVDKALRELFNNE